MPSVETSTPPKTPQPIGPYNHVAKVGSFITIGGNRRRQPRHRSAGRNRRSGADRRLQHMGDFEAMNNAYIDNMDHRPARTVIGVRELPKPGVLLTRNLTAVT